MKYKETNINARRANTQKQLSIQQFHGDLHLCTITVIRKNDNVKHNTIQIYTITS